MRLPEDIKMNPNTLYFKMSDRLVFGNGAISQVPELVEQLDRRRPLIVTDRGLVQSGVCARIVGAARNAFGTGAGPASCARAETNNKAIIIPAIATSPLLPVIRSSDRACARSSERLCLANR